MITLHRPGHSKFIVLWHDDLGWRDNLRTLRDWAKGAWSAASLEGFGCVCGWKMPTREIWPFWFWHAWWWRRHVHVCPVPRDQYGNVVSS